MFTLGWCSTGIGQTHVVLDVTTDLWPIDISPHVTINVAPGGRILRRQPATTFVNNGVLNVLGGIVTLDVHSQGNAKLALYAGTLEKGLRMSDASRLDVTTGLVQGPLLLENDSTGTLAGGLLNSLSLDDRSRVDVVGPAVLTHATAAGHSTLDVAAGVLTGEVVYKSHSSGRITGGRFTENLRAVDHSLLYLVGGEFYINGSLVLLSSQPGETTAAQLDYGDVVTGVLADGSPFRFVQTRVAFQTPGVLRFERAILPDAPAMVLVSSTIAPLSIRRGQTLELVSNGVLGPYFLAGTGSSLRMEGGLIESGFRGIETDIEIRGGVVGDDFRIVGSHLLMSGGAAGDSNWRGSEVVVSASTLGGIEAGQSSRVSIRDSLLESLKLSASSFAELSGDTQLGTLSVDRTSHAVLTGGVLAGTIGVSGNLRMMGGFAAGQFNVSGTLELVGKDFRLNGVMVSGLADPGDRVELPLGTGMLSGTLADGTPIILGDLAFDWLTTGKLILERADVAPASPAVIDVDQPSPLRRLSGNQRLNLHYGGSVGDHFRSGHGARIVLSGGTIGNNLEAAGTLVDVRAGTIGESFIGVAGTQLLVSGGLLGSSSRLVDSHLEMTAGELGERFLLGPGSTAKITGGTINRYFQLASGSHAEIHGGEFSTNTFVAVGARADIYGGSFGNHFRAGDPNASGPPTEPQPMDVASLATINVNGGQFLQNVWIQRNALVNVFNGDFLSNFLVRHGGRANVYGGHVAHFAVSEGAILHVSGGSHGNGGPFFGGWMHVTGGAFDSLWVRGGARADIYGGSFRNSFEIGLRPSTSQAGRTEDQLTLPPIVPNLNIAEIHGGTFGGSFTVHRDGLANIYAGTFANGFTIARGAVHIHGGMFSSFDIGEASSLHLYGTHFALDGEKLLPLEPNIPYLLSTRDATLTATLADRSPFELGLFTTQMPGRDYVHTGASLYLVLVQIPEPATATLALLALSGLTLRRRLFTR